MTTSECASAEKPRPPYFFWNDHAEKTVRLDELPHLWRQIMQLARNGPLVEHAAELFNRSGKKSFFLGVEFRLGVSQQFVPVRGSAEQLSFPPYGSRIQRFLLGLRYLRQDLAKNFEQPVRNERTPHRGCEKNDANNQTQRHKQRRAQNNFPAQFARLTPHYFLEPPDKSSVKRA